jgi:hypothetical protein
VLPFNMFASLQCPTPFIMGIHSEHKAQALASIDDDNVVQVLRVHLMCEKGKKGIKCFNLF